MPNILKKIPVLLFLCLLTWKINAQPPVNPISADQTTQRMMPSHRGYSWYVAEFKKRHTLANNFAAIPSTQAGMNRLPVHQSYESLRQQLISKYPMLQRNSSLGSLPAPDQQVLPVHRPFSYYQQEAMKRINEAQRLRAVAQKF